RPQPRARGPALSDRVSGCALHRAIARDERETASRKRETASEPQFLEQPRTLDATIMMRFIHHLTNWLVRKGTPRSLAGRQWTGTTFTDTWRRNPAPPPNELLGELKGTAWTCASLNAAVCAAYPPPLYVATYPDQPTARCLTRALDPEVEQRVRSLPYVRAMLSRPSLGRAAGGVLEGRESMPRSVWKSTRLEEVLEHPLLTLLARVNPVHNAFDLWELT